MFLRNDYIMSMGYNSSINILGRKMFDEEESNSSDSDSFDGINNGKWIS